jgi:hypothetical protein
LVDHGLANVAAGGGPSGDALQYASGVLRALTDRGLRDPLVAEYVGAFDTSLRDMSVAPERIDGAGPRPS